MKTVALVLLLTVLLSTAAGLKNWANSSVGIHSFLTFDSAIPSTEINASSAPKYDYVWGASPATRAQFLKYSPRTVMSRYITYDRDITGETLDWWKTNHPDMILYKCDRKTPAYVCYAGEPCPNGKRPLIPLDLGSPATVQWQLQYEVLPAKNEGYDAIAWDNFGLYNGFGGCGSYSGPNGTWVQRYTGKVRDWKWTVAVLSWTSKIKAACNAMGLLVIPNYQLSASWDSAETLAVGNLTDGVLDEGGFVYWGRGDSWQWTGQRVMSRARFENKLHFIRNLQQYGKAYFSINEWGPGASYKMNPREIPYNISGAANRWIRQFVVAAYMLTKGDASGVYLVCIQCYGHWSWWNEFEAKIGVVLSEPSLNATNGVWSREFTNAVAYLNPDVAGTNNATVHLSAQYSYTDLYGNAVPSDAPLTLPATNGVVLLRRPK